MRAELLGGHVPMVLAHDAALHECEVASAHLALGLGSGLGLGFGLGLGLG